MTALLAPAAATTVVEPGPPCDCCGDRRQPKERTVRGRLLLVICVEPTPCINRAVSYGRWKGRLS